MPTNTPFRSHIRLSRLPTNFADFVRWTLALAPCIAGALPGCAGGARDHPASSHLTADSSPAGTARSITLVASTPVQRDGLAGKYWDDRGVQIHVTPVRGETGWLLGGEIQSVNRGFIGVSSVEFALDGKTERIEASRTGQAIDDIVRGTKCWREQFVAQVDRAILARVAESTSPSVRVIGTDDTTPRFRIPDDAIRMLRSKFGSQSPPSGTPLSTGLPSPANDPTYPFKLVKVLSQPAEFGGARCGLTVEGDGWHKSKFDGVWNAVLRRYFGANEVSCLLESDSASTVQRVELEAEFDQPGLHESAMLLQFAQSAQILMHPTVPPNEFAEAVTKKGEWSNDQWELKRESYANGGFGLMLRRKTP